MAIATDQYHSESHEKNSLESDFWLSEHDKEHPFSMISNALMRDKDITPQCRFLIAYILGYAKIPNFKLRVMDLINQFKGYKGYGRDKIYFYIDEAIQAGYILRKEYIENNLKRTSYGISEFKKFFRLPELQDTGNQDAFKRKENIKEKESIYTLSKESPPIQENEGGRIDLKDSVKTTADLNPLNANELRPIPKQKQETEIAKSDDTRQVIDLMYSEIKRLKPNALIKPSPKWSKDIKELLKHRTVAQLEAVIKWVYDPQNGWSKYVFNSRPTNTIKNNLDSIETQMQSGLKTQEKVKPAALNSRIGDVILKEETSLKKRGIAVGKCNYDEGIWIQGMGANSFVTNIYFNDPLFESKIEKEFQKRSIPFDVNHIKSLLNSLQSFK